MRIAQVAPLIETVPPPLYGGTERVVSWLTEELVRRGHDVTLFASGDSHTRADLRSVLDRSIRLHPDSIDPLAAHVLELSEVFQQADDFDIIHCHVDFLAFPFACACNTPTLHTLHGRLDLPYWSSIAAHYHNVPLVSISHAQRSPLSHIAVNWASTIYHGMPSSCIKPGEGKGEYLAFFARFSREKRPDLAIEIAKRVGIPLKMAGKVDRLDLPYFKEEIEPLLDHPLIEYIGEIGEEKLDLLGNALAMIFPVDWPEPFGLVMIEALACGTPVITRPRGSIPEIIENGKTGFIAESVDELVAAVRHIDKIDRSYCVETVKKRFSDSVMAAQYEAVYEKLMKRKHIPGPISSQLLQVPLPFSEH